MALMRVSFIIIHIFIFFTQFGHWDFWEAVMGLCVCVCVNC